MKKFFTKIFTGIALIAGFIGISSITQSTKVSAATRAVTFVIDQGALTQGNPILNSRIVVAGAIKDNGPAGNHSGMVDYQSARSFTVTDGKFYDVTAYGQYLFKGFLPVPFSDRNAKFRVFVPHGANVVYIR